VLIKREIMPKSQFAWGIKKAQDMAEKARRESRRYFWLGLVIGAVISILIGILLL
jgi:hypothetical protein